jgi:hypothetical protein
MEIAMNILARVRRRRQTFLAGWARAAAFVFKNVTIAS